MGRVNSVTDLNASLEDVLPGVLDDLRRLVAIPSVSSLSEHDDDVLAAADLVSSLLTDAGCPDVRRIEAGGKPSVLGSFPGPEGAPTVLLYAHYDVQPTGDLSQWTKEPFEATEIDGRLWGRGAADDKGGFAVHLATLRTWQGRLPVGVKVLVEGEEELGSPTVEALLEKYPEELDADVYVIADSMNWQAGVPSLTTSLRGVVDARVTVSTLEAPMHSGGYGGVVPDALTALSRLLATLHDERGNVAIEGLEGSDEASVDYPEDRIRAETGLLEGVELIGDGPAAARLWHKPTASVLAIDATPVKDASNVLVPSARAVVSVRLAPTQDTRSAAEALERHLRSHAPWGARVEIEFGRGGAGSLIDLDDPRAQAGVESLREAFGVEPVQIGVGGSIPIVAALTKRYPDALVLVTAVVDPDSRMHGFDESLGLDDFRKAAYAEVLLLDKLARGRA